MPAPPQSGSYRVVYADPPWRFATYSDKGKGRSAEAHYDCLSIDDIKAFPVAAWAARRSSRTFRTESKVEGRKSIDL